MTKQVLVVLSNATEGDDDEFNRWYSDEHLADVLKLKGYVAAQRFKLSEDQIGRGEVPYRYFSLYEIETDDPADAPAALATGLQTMALSPTLDLSRTVAWYYTPVTGRVTE